MKRNEMHMAYGTYVGGEKCIQTDFFGGGKLMDGGHIEDPSLDSK